MKSAIRVLAALFAAVIELGLFVAVYCIASAFGKLYESSGLDATPVLVVLVIGWLLYSWHQWYKTLGEGE